MKNQDEVKQMVLPLARREAIIRDYYANYCERRKKFLNDEEYQSLLKEYGEKVRKYALFGGYGGDRNLEDMIQEAEKEAFLTFCKEYHDELVSQIENIRSYERHILIEAIKQQNGERSYWGNSWSYSNLYVTEIKLIDGSVIKTHIPSHSDGSINLTAYELGGWGVVMYIDSVKMEYDCTHYDGHPTQDCRSWVTHESIICGIYGVRANAIHL